MGNAEPSGTARWPARSPSTWWARPCILRKTRTLFDASTTDRTTRSARRCDSPALAEDEIGTLICVGVRSADLGDGSFDLPIGPRRRAALLAYVRETCGFPQQ